MSVESPQKFHIQPEKLDIDFKSEIYSQLKENQEASLTKLNGSDEKCTSKKKRKSIQGRQGKKENRHVKSLNHTRKNIAASVKNF